MGDKSTASTLVAEQCYDTRVRASRSRQAAVHFRTRHGEHEQTCTPPWPGTVQPRSGPSTSTRSCARAVQHSATEAGSSELRQQTTTGLRQTTTRQTQSTRTLIALQAIPAAAAKLGVDNEVDNEVREAMARREKVTWIWRELIREDTRMPSVNRGLCRSSAYLRGGDSGSTMNW